MGTINLDYRSLYHHFEDAVWMKDAACIPAIEKDFQKTLEFCRDVEPTRESIWRARPCSIWRVCCSKSSRRCCKETSQSKPKLTERFLLSQIILIQREAPAADLGDMAHDEEAGRSMLWASFSSRGSSRLDTMLSSTALVRGYSRPRRGGWSRRGPAGRGWRHRCVGLAADDLHFGAAGTQHQHLVHDDGVDEHHHDA